MPTWPNWRRHRTTNPAIWGFESLRGRWGEVHQVERSALTREAVGSNPSSPSICSVFGRYRTPDTSGRGAVWSAHLVRIQGAVGSNPAVQTTPPPADLALGLRLLGVRFDSGRGLQVFGVRELPNVQRVEVLRQHTWFGTRKPGFNSLLPDHAGHWNAQGGASAIPAPPLPPWC